LFLAIIRITIRYGLRLLSNEIILDVAIVLIREMSRRVHPEPLQERRAMKEAVNNRKDGDWCVAATHSDRGFESGLQDWGLTKSEAKETAEELNNEEEFEHFDNIAMTHNEYEERASEFGDDRDSFPWN
jgi:hypothetical protein